ncbi:MAG TPA: [acyl-carrier-protein] S-malonyltransferase [Actinobacteria bacterium]|nr:[acyl-carrier-protein] S-malonyltransferase [Actinomycetota bacterium]
MEKKIAFVFPGQGSQYVGMGQNLKESMEEISVIFEKADEILQRQISDICFKGPKGELDKTINTQPAIFVVNYACYRALCSEGIEPDIVAGHSLGEYNALVAAGVLDFETGLRLIEKRAYLMEKIASNNPSKMIAVLGLSSKEVDEVINLLKVKGIINGANYNCPGQIVVSGENLIIDEAIQLFKQSGAKRVVELPVNGGFHSNLMGEAEDEFSKFLKDVSFKKAKCGVVSNFSGKFSTNPMELKTALNRQITSSVRWEESVNEICSFGAKIFVEVGPKKILSGLVSRIVPDVAQLNVEDVGTLKKTVFSIRRG